MTLPENSGAQIVTAIMIAWASAIAWFDWRQRRIPNVLTLGAWVLGGAVLVQGAGKRAEVWDAKRWAAYEKSKVAPAYKAIGKNLEI